MFAYLYVLQMYKLMYNYLYFLGAPYGAVLAGPAVGPAALAGPIAAPALIAGPSGSIAAGHGGLGGIIRGYAPGHL